MSWSTLRKEIIGLSNTNGKTCYINSVLQCFASTPPLLEWLFDHVDKLETCTLTNHGILCSICEITKIIRSIHPSSTNNNIQLNSSSAQSAESFQAQVGSISCALSPADQQDVTEFITLLFDHCIDCLPSHLSIPSVPSLTTTFIYEIFRINLSTSYQCISCADSFEREEDLLLLSVDVYNLNSLPDALTDFAKQDTVQNDCVNCGKNVTKRKRTTFQEVPPILMIYFKKYSFTTSACKLSHRVNYDEYLDTSPYMTSLFINSNNANQHGNSSNNLYKLYGVICHVGDDPRKGHYYSYIRSSDDSWLVADDSHCRRVSSSDVFNHTNAYVLLYSKASDASNINISSCEQQQQHQQQQSGSLVSESNSIDLPASTVHPSV